MVKYKFNDIAINSTLKKKPVEDDKYHYIGLEHLDSGSLQVTRYGSEVAPKGEKLIMKKGDVLFGKRRAYQKKVGIAPFDGIFSAHGMVLRPKEDVVDKDFFPLFINSDYFLDAAIKISVGSLSPTINWGDLKELEFELPGLKEQRKLAKILWAAEEIKQTYKKLLQKTDDMVKAKFDEMFLNKNYRTKSISEISNFCTRGKSPKYVNKSNLLVINQACIYWDKIKYENVKFNDPLYDGDRLLENGDILINSTGTGTLGRCNIFNENNNNKYMADSHITIIRLSEMNPYFFKCWFKREETQDYIYKNCVSGSTNQIELSREKLRKVEIVYPPLDIQNQFAQFFMQAEQSKQQLQKSLDCLNTMMKALINENLK